MSYAGILTNIASACISNLQGTRITVEAAAVAGTDMETMDSGSQALAVRYIQKPQDGHADTVAKLSFSPSYVTYNPVTIENVQSFFKTGEVTRAGILLPV